jgi:hypothetical protein
MYLHCRNKIVLGLLLSTVAINCVAATTVTCTWSDADNNQQEDSHTTTVDNLDWGNGHFNHFNGSSGNIYGDHVTAVASTFTGRSWNYTDNSWFSGSCFSGSSSSHQDWHQTKDGTVTSPVFPIIHVLGAGNEDALSSPRLNYTGLWVKTYDEVINGSATTNSYSYTFPGTNWDDIILGARGTETCSSSNRTDVAPDPDPDTVHTGYTESMDTLTFTASATYKAAYAGATNSYAMLLWNYWPTAALQCSTNSGGGSENQNLYGGQETGPGSQRSAPLEQFSLDFVAE